MSVFLATLCCVLLALLLAYIAKTRQMVRDLEQAIRSGRRLMLHESSRRLEQLGFIRLATEVNRMVDRYRDYADENSGYSTQVEAVLGSIQEAVLIFDEDHIIEYANESARRLFQGASVMKGVRLESLLRSSSLLEFVGSHANRDVSQLSQVSVERSGELLWFEASCGLVSGVSAPEAQSTLLVLHDITRLKSLEEVRRDFVANVSHELRTPLTIIKGFAETLVDDNATMAGEARIRFLDKILNNAERLHVLVEDLLTLSKLESQPDQIELGLHSLRQLFEETAENYRSRLNEQQQSIRIVFDEHLEDFAFDRYRILQVIDNLVENAFRYAPEFSQLVLRAEIDPENACVRCCVEDDGPGIPSKDLTHIFERFYRVDKGRSRERGGTGLGLSIMKHIVQLHGGRVYADSVLGEGTRIYFTLPYEPRRMAAQL